MNQKINKPIFIFAGGQRCGSTLLQRILLQSGYAWIWGEHGGLLKEFIAADKKMVNWKNDIDKNQLNNFEKYNSPWIPNMTPELAWWRHSIKIFITTWLESGAARRGYDRWGFKEVRYGYEEIAWLREIFPESQIIIIVRNPRDCLKSIKAQPWYKKEFGNSNKFLNEWARIGESLWNFYNKYNQCLLVKYENLVSNPEKQLEKIEDFLQLPKQSLPVNIIKNKEGVSTQKPLELSEEDEKLIKQENIQRVISLIYKEN